MLPSKPTWQEALGYGLRDNGSELAVFGVLFFASVAATVVTIRRFRALWHKSQVRARDWILLSFVVIPTLITGYLFGYFVYGVIYNTFA